MDRKKPYQNLPDTPGVYLMKNALGGILYIGKAGNLKRRVSSYFQRPQEHRIQKMVNDIQNIEIRQTDTAIEALILESALIKKFQPPFNVLEKDDKSFLYVEITKDKFPRVLLVRGKKRSGGREFGPFTSATSIREALRILRRIFPWSIHSPEFLLRSLKPTTYSPRSSESGAGNLKPILRPCFEYEIGLCPGTCIGAITAKDYKANIKKLVMFFEGKKTKLLKTLEKEMQSASRKLEYEKATVLRKQIFALKHIQDVALLTEDKFAKDGGEPMRIEGYDISHISGDSATGSMVVFVNGEPDKNEYRKFKIQDFNEPNDVGMMKEVLRRRFKHSSPNSSRVRSDGQPIAKGDLGWPLPNLILIDGGAGQVNVAKAVLEEYGLRIPVIGLVKGPKRKRNDFIGFVPRGIEKKTLIQVRDEAHRFAISYHRKLRNVKMIGS